MAFRLVFRLSSTPRPSYSRSPKYIHLTNLIYHQSIITRGFASNWKDLFDQTKKQIFKDEDKKENPTENTSESGSKDGENTEKTDSTQSEKSSTRESEFVRRARAAAQDINKKPFESITSKAKEFLDPHNKGIKGLLQELLEGNKEKNVNKSLKRETPKGADSAQDDEGSKVTALVIVEQKKSVWEEIAERFKDAPVIRTIIDETRKSAEKIKKTSAAKTAQQAKEKIQEVVDDSKKVWETSQHPLIYQVSSVVDYFTSDTEQAVVLRELRKLDPRFTFESFKDIVSETLFPEVLTAFLRADLETLKSCTSEGLYTRFEIEFKILRDDNKVLDDTVLAVRNAEITGVKNEPEGPIVMVQFMAQQIDCVRNLQGEVVEGAEDKVKATFYAVAFQRIYDEHEIALKWVVVDFMLVGNFPLLI